MYQINKDVNRIEALKVRQFSELGFRERDHLQEWLANNPAALGEELLIIQKEFDGFDDTRERLDLLALDKDGALVVIENKLDDSGRDVAWQALKYASYCSSLTKSQIAEIYQQYLDQQPRTVDQPRPDAREQIAAFYEGQEFAELELNTGTDQRILFVAANFRKEVTSTALWLLSHKIRLQCIRATPYSLGEQLFLNLQQIIPVPEAEEYMIGMSEKAQELKSVEHEQKNRHRIRLEFWEQALAEINGSNKTQLFSNISPSRGHWLNAGSGMRGVPFTLVFGKNFARVQLEINRSDQSENKTIFDRLALQREAIDTAFGAPLAWERMDDNKMSLIKLEQAFDGYDRDNWPEIIDWMLEQVVRLEKAMKGPLQAVSQALKASPASIDGSDTAEIAGEL